MCLLVVAVVGSASAGQSKDCGRFIVGEANSTAYADMELPARGVASDASCATLKRIARRLHDGTYRIPSDAWEQAPAYGRSFTIRDRGKRWSCRVQNIGASGPSYAVRCRRSYAVLRWRTG